MPEPTTATRLATWSRTYPATAAHVAEARRSLALLLDGTPAAADALLCLSEIVTNSIMHSRSAQPGGHITVRVTRTPGRLRVEVQDQGGPWAQRVAGEDHGRGLTIVKALTAYLDISDLETDSRTRTVTFEMSFP